MIKWLGRNGLALNLIMAAVLLGMLWGEQDYINRIQHQTETKYRMAMQEGFAAYSRNTSPALKVYCDSIRAEVWSMINADLDARGVHYAVMEE